MNEFLLDTHSRCHAAAISLQTKDLTTLKKEKCLLQFDFREGRASDQCQQVQKWDTKA